MKNMEKIIGVTAPRCEKSIVNLTIHQFAESLGNAIDAKDHYTCSHSEEVAVVAQVLGTEFGLDSDRCELLHIAGHLHDIGKIGVPDSILKKSGGLTEDEYELIKKHPVMGAQIVAPVASVSGIDIVADIILHHHERFDGKGYPYGLKGEAIPLEARIIAVADTISAMARSRPYRAAIPFTEIVNEIQECSGTQFDPAVVRSFMTVSDRVEQYYSWGKNYSDEFFHNEFGVLENKKSLSSQRH